MHAGVAADLVLRGGQLLTLTRGSASPTALAVSNGVIAAIGSDEAIAPLIRNRTTVIELNGRTVMPGLIDGHAHLDREGLKQLLPSLAGCPSVSAIVDRLSRLAAQTPPGRWIVTMPLGEPPEYRWSESMFEEGRLPDRRDLDRASSAHPILIRSAWGYWPGRVPLVTIANSVALERSGMSSCSASPSPLLRIERDGRGNPTGRVFEDTFQPLAEFTLFRDAPNFTAEDRMRTLRASMRAYNEAGTTGIFEGHGVADDVIDAYRRVKRDGGMTVRASLVFSPGWSGASEADVASWVQREAARLRGEGDEWLRIAGVFSEMEAEPAETRLRASCAPQTGWAGFRYDSGLPRAALDRLLEAAARERLRVCTLHSAMVDRFIAIGERVPIDDLRWVVAHPSTLDAAQIAGLAAHGIVVTALTGTFIWRRASTLLARIGTDLEETICPLRSLLDAGVPTVLASDNVPVSLWPCIWHACERIDRETGRVIAPGQRITRGEALQCSTVHAAWLCKDEEARGTLEPGRHADLIVLPDNPLTVDAERLPALVPELTIVGGKVVSSRA
jgi:predicted amidohydrolase YtcJ